MADESVLLPLFPVSGVLVPHGSMIIAATQSPYIELLSDCIEQGNPFGTVYFDEWQIADVGCTAFIKEWQTINEGLICRVTGGPRFSVSAIVSLEGNRQRVIQNGREVVFEDEGAPSLPYDFVNATLLIDQEGAVNPDVKAAVLERFLEEVPPESAEEAGEIRTLFENGLEGQLSFWILDQLIPNDTPEGNQVRLDFLRKRSENKRFRMLRNSLSPQGQP